MKARLIIIKVPKAPFHLFPENYVPAFIITKLTLTSQQKHPGQVTHMQNEAKIEAATQSWTFGNFDPRRSIF